MKTWREFSYEIFCRSSFYLKPNGSLYQIRNLPEIDKKSRGKGLKKMLKRTKKTEECFKSLGNRMCVFE